MIWRTRPTVTVLSVAYAIAGATAYQFSRPEETIVAGLCFLCLIAYARGRGDPRWLWIVVFPLPAFVLFHEQLGLHHALAVAPAAASLVIAFQVDRDRG